MVILATKKGVLDYFINANEEEIKWVREQFGTTAKVRESRFIIRIGDDDESKRCFANWTKEDYLYAIEVGTILKEEWLNILMDFYLNPRAYTDDKGKTIFSRILGKDSDLSIDTK